MPGGLKIVVKLRGVLLLDATHHRIKLTGQLRKEVILPKMNSIIVLEG